MPSTKRQTIVEHLCPYYFRKCTLKECSERPTDCDPVEWKRQIDKLAGCSHAGVELSKQDYKSRQERVVIEEKKEKKR